jgi:hypothetical protein
LTVFLAAFLAFFATRLLALVRFFNVEALAKVRRVLRVFFLAFATTVSFVTYKFVGNNHQREALNASLP